MKTSKKILRYELLAETRPSSAFTQGFGFVKNDRTLSDIPERDFFITVPLFKKDVLHEYVDIQKDNTIQKVERQEVNPFFLEYKFFDDVTKNKVNNGSDLTLTMITLIRSVRPELNLLTNDEIVAWFDNIGKNELPWNTTSGNITIYDIETAQPVLTSLVSRANFLNIDIHR
jgi:hypothetical protein